LRYCASGWFYCRNILRCKVLQTSNTFYVTGIRKFSWYHHIINSISQTL